MNQCDYCQQCGQRLTEPCGCKPRDELFYDPASVAWSGIDRAQPGTDRTTLVIHTPNGKDDPLYLKLAAQCVKHGWVILRMEDDGTVYDDMLGALGEDRGSVGVTEEYRGQRFVSSHPYNPDEWPSYEPMTPEQRAEYERRLWDQTGMRYGVSPDLLQSIAASESAQATREKVRGTVTLPCEQMRYGWHNPTPEQFEAPLRLGTFGRLDGFTFHKTVPLVGQIDLGNDIKRQRAERKRQSQAELAKIRRRKGGY